MHILQCLMNLISAAVNVHKSLNFNVLVHCIIGVPKETVNYKLLSSDTF